MSVLLIAFLGVAAVLVALLLYEAFGAARQLARDDGRLRLKNVARALGFAVPPPGTEAAMKAQVLAERRCVACRQRARCDELVAGGDWDALRALCPNVSYFDSLRAG